MDRSNFSVRMTLWGKQAEQYEAADQPVIAFKGIKVGDFQGSLLPHESVRTMLTMFRSLAVYDLFEYDGRQPRYSRGTLPSRLVRRYRCRTIFPSPLERNVRRWRCRVRPRRNPQPQRSEVLRAWNVRQNGILLSSCNDLSHQGGEHCLPGMPNARLR